MRDVSGKEHSIQKHKDREDCKTEGKKQFYFSVHSYHKNPLGTVHPKIKTSFHSKVILKCVWLYFCCRTHEKNNSEEEIQSLFLQ